MIVVYIPTYFDPMHPYCAREYKAMEQLEAERLKWLGPDIKQHGFIIPIIFRGAQRLPEEIKKQRLYYNFEDFLLSDVEIAKHPYYAGEIKKIAEYIATRWQECAELFRDEDPCANCADFTLPAAEEIQDWIEDVAGTLMSFPGR